MQPASVTASCTVATTATPGSHTPAATVSVVSSIIATTTTPAAAPAVLSMDTAAPAIAPISTLPSPAVPLVIDSNVPSISAAAPAAGLATASAVGLATVPIASSVTASVVPVACDTLEHSVATAAVCTPTSACKSSLKTGKKPELDRTGRKKTGLQSWSLIFKNQRPQKTGLFGLV
jgi:hypothetical protein